MPLYGHEMDETVNPLETGLDFGVKMNKPEFIGKAGIEAHPVTRERIGLKVTGRGIIREGEDVYLGGEKIGRTTSGCLSIRDKRKYIFIPRKRGNREESSWNFRRHYSTRKLTNG